MVLLRIILLRLSQAQKQGQGEAEGDKAAGAGERENQDGSINQVNFHTKKNVWNQKERSS